MIELVTAEDMKWFGTKLQEVMERTKSPPNQIMELQKQLRELERGLKK